MASVLSSPSTTGSEDPAKIDFLKNALYETVKDNSSTTQNWTQSALLDLDTIPGNSVNLLIKVLQSLTDDFLFLTVTDGHLGLCWKWRSEKDAQTYKQIPHRDHRLVYELADEAGADGIWLGSLRRRLKMHKNVVDSGVKYLETRGFIRSMQSIDAPVKKMYIKASLEPSDKVTGGPWFTDSNFDEGFVDELQKIIFEYVKNHRKFLQRTEKEDEIQLDDGRSRQARKGIIKGGDKAGTKRRAEAISTDDPEDVAQSAKAYRHRHTHRQREGTLPLPAGYRLYPTVSQIADWIAKEGLTNNIHLHDPEIQQLVDCLVYDKLLEPVELPITKETGYRVANIARVAAQSQKKSAVKEGEIEQLGAPPLDNGYTEVPCGRCPVFDLCEVGGPVSPSNCEYFPKWLGLDTEPSGAGRQGVAATVVL